MLCERSRAWTFLLKSILNCPSFNQCATNVIVMRKLLTLGIASLLFTACDSRTGAGASASVSTSASTHPPTPAPSIPVATPTPSPPVATAAPSAPSAPTASAALRAACAKTCKATAGKCSPQAKCVEGCLRNMVPQKCEATLLEFMACAARLGPDKWECSDEVPAVKEGSCDPEQARVAGCLRNP